MVSGLIVALPVIALVGQKKLDGCAWSPSAHRIISSISLKIFLQACLPAAEGPVSAPAFLPLSPISLFLFFSCERGETSPHRHPPSRGNGFPGPLLCQLLAAVVLQSKRCRNPFSGQCPWFSMLPPLCVWVCVLLKGGGWVWMTMSLINICMNICRVHFRPHIHALSVGVFLNFNSVA